MTITLHPWELQALQQGRLSVLIRPVEPQPAYCCRYEINGNGDKWLHISGENRSPVFVPVRPDSADTYIECPYGVPGDRLWVAEPWCRATDDPLHPGYCYKATHSPDDFSVEWEPASEMPKCAARYTLTITSVDAMPLEKVSEDEFAAWSEAAWDDAYMMFPASGNPWVWVIGVER